jgi:hypothetical protein
MSLATMLLAMTESQRLLILKRQDQNYCIPAIISFRDSIARLGAFRGAEEFQRSYTVFLDSYLQARQKNYFSARIGGED